MQGTTPVLLVTEDRHYGVAIRQGYTPSAAQPAAVSTISPTEEVPVSALEAVYGKTPQRAPGAARQSTRELTAAVIQAEAASQRWANLFDVPSHVLPGVSTLCSSFLELLTTSVPREEL